MRKYLLLALILLVQTGTAEQLPFKSFGHLPIVDQPTISPNGKFVASILNSEEGPTIFVSELGTSDIKPIVRLKYGRDRIEWIRWASDERVLVSVSEAMNLTADKFRVSRLYQVGRDGKGMKQVWRKPTRRVAWWVNLFDTDNILSMLPEKPNKVLMQLYDERDEGFTVFEVDIVKNKFKKMFVNEYGVQRWFANGNGEVVLGLESEEDEVTLWYRPEGTKKWQPMHTRKILEDVTFSPVMINGDKVTVISDHELGRQALWRYDIPSGTYEELIYSVDGYDIAGALMSPDGSRLLGVYYYDHFRRDHYFDDDAAAKANLVKQTFPDYLTSVVSRSKAGNRMMVQAVRDNVPPKYFWLDLKQKTGGPWFGAFPSLNGKVLPEVTPIQYEASDGSQINGYLTLPLAAESAKPPLIVMPHGGPHARDYQYFDPFVQFFANRGYAVLQINFRGSSGYNSAFEVSGYKQWGQSMQQDIYEAVDWLATQDLVDTERKCIVGASYGGYAALVAAYQRPTDYECVASIAGIADLYEMVDNSIRNPNMKHYVKKMIGDPNDDADRKMLKNYSAVNHLDDIKAPLMVIHGTEDTRVRVAQSRNFYRDAKSAGIEIEYLELEDGTHFLDEYNNRLAVFQALETFLQRHL